MDQGAGEWAQDEGKQPRQEEDHDHVVEVSQQRRDVVDDDERHRHGGEYEQRREPAMLPRGEPAGRGHRLLAHAPS